jgi:hypothetical protein
MEKKINKNFFYLSAINLIPAFWLGGGLTLDSLALVAVLAALVINYVALIKMVSELSSSMSRSSDDAGSPVGRLLMFFGLKVLMLGGLVGIIFFYKKELISYVILMMIFQLIIQFVSITTNHLKS